MDHLADKNAQQCFKLVISNRVDKRLSEFVAICYKTTVGLALSPNQKRMVMMRIMGAEQRIQSEHSLKYLFVLIVLYPIISQDRLLLIN